MFKKILYLSVALTTLSYSFINIEPSVIGEKEGLDGEVSVGAKYNTGNSDTRSVGISAKGQYSEKEWLAYLVSAYTYGESNGREDTNDGIFHLRYIHRMANTAYDYELFFQTEFNKFQDIKTRDLAGANIRRKLELSFDKFYVGLGLFYSYMEPDTVTPIDPIYKRTKINSYISFLKKINEHFSITYLGYYQPNVEDFSDFTVSETLQINTLLTDALVLSFDILHTYNATPYHEIEKNDIRSTINLKYKLK